VYWEVTCLFSSLGQIEYLPDCPGGYRACMPLFSRNYLSQCSSMDDSGLCANLLRMLLSTLSCPLHSPLGPALPSRTTPVSADSASVLFPRSSVCVCVQFHLYPPGPLSVYVSSSTCILLVLCLCMCPVPPVSSWSYVCVRVSSWSSDPVCVSASLS